MKKNKIIGIFGCEQTDICIYLASILENMRMHVLVIDNSFEQKMQFCIPRPEEKLKVVTYKNVDYMSLCEEKQWLSREYDFTIVNFGSWPEENELQKCDELLCVMNCEYFQMKKYNDVIARLERPVVLVFRDFCKSYMDTEKIKKQVGDQNCFVMDHFFLPFLESDECCRLLMQFDGYQNFGYLSKEFEKVLFQICRIISEGEFAEVRNGMNRAKRGDCY